MKKKIVFYWLNGIGYTEKQENISIDSTEQQVNRNSNLFKTKKKKSLKTDKNKNTFFYLCGFLCILTILFFLSTNTNPEENEFLSLFEKSLNSKTITEDLKNKFQEFNTDIFVLFIENEQKEISIRIFDKNIESPVELNLIQGLQSKDPIILTSQFLLQKKKTLQEIKKYIKKEDCIIHWNNHICVSGYVFLSSFTEVKIVFTQKRKKIPPHAISDIAFCRRIKNEETEINDDFCKLLSEFFLLSFEETHLNISRETLIKDKDFSMVFEIEDGLFKKKAVRKEEWKETIVPEKEILNLFKIFSRFFFFFFDSNELFFLQQGKFSLLENGTFLNLEITNIDLAFKIQEKAKQKQNFLFVLSYKQLQKQAKLQGKGGKLYRFKNSFETEDFPIKETLIDNNMLTEAEILEAINTA